MVSVQGRNLTIAIVAGLLVGGATWMIQYQGVPLTFYLLQVNGAVLQGWVLPVVTSILVVPPTYLGFFDALFNAAAVLYLDRLISSSFSPKWYYATFAVAGVAGNLVSLWANLADISFGASGGIFGLLAGAVTSEVGSDGRVDPALIAWFVFIFAVSSFLIPQVDWPAHLGGAATGASIGYVAGLRRRGNAGSIL